MIESTKSFRHKCRDCGKQRTLSGAAMARVSGKRCLACGGTLEMLAVLTAEHNCQDLPPNQFKKGVVKRKTPSKNPRKKKTKHRRDIDLSDIFRQFYARRRRAQQ